MKTMSKCIKSWLISYYPYLRLSLWCFIIFVTYVDLEWESECLVITYLSKIETKNSKIVYLKKKKKSNLVTCYWHWWLSFTLPLKLNGKEWTLSLSRKVAKGVETKGFVKKSTNRSLDCWQLQKQDGNVRETHTIDWNLLM